MSALFNFNSLIRIIFLSACTATYLKKYFPAKLKQNISSKENMPGSLKIFYIGIAIGERLTPYLAFICVCYGVIKIVSIFK